MCNPFSCIAETSSCSGPSWCSSHNTLLLGIEKCMFSWFEWFMITFSSVRSCQGLPVVTIILCYYSLRLWLGTLLHLLWAAWAIHSHGFGHSGQATFACGPGCWHGTENGHHHLRFGALDQQE